VKVTYCLQDNPSSPPAQVLILVSRKRFRKAFRRNRIKRLLREAYRLEKHQFYNYLNNVQKNCLIAISYVADNELSLDEIRKSIRTSLQKICDNDASKNSMA
jgi:ribonuclease P protein component